MSFIIEQTFLLVSKNYLVFRTWTVDADGDPWFRVIFGLYLVFVPMLLKLTPIINIIAGTCTAILYVIMFRDQFKYAILADSAIPQAIVIVYLIVFIVVSTFMMSQFEKEERRAFIINLGLVRHNDKLRHQLTSLQKTYSSKATDLESPLEKALMTLKGMMANPNLDEQMYIQIQETIQRLSASENIFTPSLNIRKEDDEADNIMNDQEEVNIIILIFP